MWQHRRFQLVVILLFFSPVRYAPLGTSSNLSVNNLILLIINKKYSDHLSSLIWQYESFCFLCMWFSTKKWNIMTGKMKYMRWGIGGVGHWMNKWGSIGNLSSSTNSYDNILCSKSVMTLNYKPWTWSWKSRSKR